MEYGIILSISVKPLHVFAKCVRINGCFEHCNHWTQVGGYVIVGLVLPLGLKAGGKLALQFMDGHGLVLIILNKFDTSGNLLLFANWKSTF